MQNLYKNSWKLYKAHSELFNDDFQYYEEFCRGKKSLDIFAGYGRLTNYLLSRNIYIEAVEIENNFSQLIQLPIDKNHNCDILDFHSESKFERIIAGYNSFCLITEDEMIRRFFLKMYDLLSHDGMLSLSYFPITAWSKAPPQRFDLDDTSVDYYTTLDLSAMRENIAVWIDNYKLGFINYQFRYPVRIFSNTEIASYANLAGLELVDNIYDYNNPLIVDAGWCEYVFKKSTRRID